MPIRENLDQSVEDITPPLYSLPYSPEYETKDVVKTFLTDNHAVYNFADYVASSLSNDFQEDPDFIKTINERMTGYEEYYDELKGARNAEELAFLKSKIDDENERAEVFANSTGTQKLLSMGALIGTDPAVLVPILGGLSKAATGVKALGVAEEAVTAGSLAAKTAAWVSVEEAALQANVETRTAADSALTIASAGIVAAGVGKYINYLSKADVDSLAAKVNSDMKATFSETGGAVGADEVVKFAEEGISGLDKTTAFYDKLPSFMKSPVVELALSPSKMVRSFNEKLADLNLVRNKNLSFKASNVSAESLKRQMQDELASINEEIFSSSFKKYRERTKGTDTLSEKKFSEEVYLAGIRGDKSIIPEVQEAATRLRREVIDKINKEAEDSGLIEKAEDLKVQTAESWMPRYPLVDKIRKNFSEFADVAFKNFKSKEADKVGVITDVKTSLAKRKDLQRELRKIEAKKQRASASVEELAAKEELLTELNKYAYSRSSGLSENIDDLKMRYEGIAGTIEEELSKLDDLTEAIRYEKGEIEGLVDAEREMQRISRTLSNIHREADLDDMLSSIEELGDAIDTLDSVFRKAINSQKDIIKDITESEEFTALSSLLTQKKELLSGTKTLRKEMRRLKSEYTAELSAKKDKGKETGKWQNKIRNRANEINKRRSGKEYKIEDLTSSLERLNKKLEENELELREKLSGYKGKTVNDVRGIIAKNEMGAKQSRLVLNAARRLSRRIIKDDAELKDLSRQFADRYANTAGRRIPYDSKPSRGFVRKNLSRKSLRHRSWDIMDEEIKDWVVTDAKTLIDNHIRTMAADISLFRNYKTLDVNEITSRIREDYAAFREAKVKEIVDGKEVYRKITPAETQKLNQRMKNDIKVFEAMWERHRGTYAMPDDYLAPQHVVERTAMRLNYVTKMGGMALASIPDLARFVMTKGFTNTYGKMFSALANDAKGLGKNLEEIKKLGYSIDSAMGAFNYRRWDAEDFSPVMTKVDTAMLGASKIMTTLSGANIWNGGLRRIAGALIQDEMGNAVKTISEGGMLDPKLQANLAANFIDKDMAVRIAKEIDTHGEKGLPLISANTANWTDIEAARVFKAAISKQVEEIIISPGQHKPLWMSRPGMRLIGQFKSFSYASNVKVAMAGLQQGDARAVSGALYATLLGSMSYMIRRTLAGKEVESDPEKLILEGIDRSGVTGSFFDVHNVVEKATGYGLHSFSSGEPLSRYQSGTLASSLLGPSFGLVQNMSSVTRATLTGEWSKSDVRAAKNLLPFSSLPGFSYALNKLEETAVK